MTQSGMWLPAKAVRVACNLTLNNFIDGWIQAREKSLSLRMDRGRWSWRKMAQVKLTREEARAESNVYVDHYDTLIKKPMINRAYSSITKLLALAEQAENLYGGAQIFVSSDDHYLIHEELQGLLNNDNNSASVSGDGDHHIGDGEPGA